MTSRRHALALAAALTAALLTGVFAVAGISHRPAGSTANTPAPAYRIAPQPAPTASHWVDD